MEITMRKSLEILNLISKLFVRFFSPQKSFKTLLETRALVGTPSGVSKFDFYDNIVSKNSRHQRALKRGKLGRL